MSDRGTFGSRPRFEAESIAALKAGKRICKECGSPVLPPRRSWCSQECVDAYNDRRIPIRPFVWERDQGVCAMCGIKCQGGAYDDQGNWRHDWEADHIVPLVEGGCHTPENVRTLCIACHKSVTKELRKRMSRARRKQ